MQRAVGAVGGDASVGASGWGSGDVVVEGSGASWQLLSARAGERRAWRGRRHGAGGRPTEEADPGEGKHNFVFLDSSR